MTNAANIIKLTKPAEICSVKVGFFNCQRKGAFKVEGERGCFCKQHAEILARRRG